MVMWISTGKKMVVLPNRLVTPMENVITEIFQLSSHRERLCETGFVSCHHHSVQINMLVNNATQTVASLKDKHRLAIKVLLKNLVLLYST